MNTVEKFLKERMASHIAAQDPVEWPKRLSKIYNIFDNLIYFILKLTLLAAFLEV